MGMTFNIGERMEEIKERRIPMVMRQTCRDWERWTKSNVVEQVDAGI